jgi:hypothetical protein
VESLQAPPLVEETPFWQKPATRPVPRIEAKEEAPHWQHRLLRWGTVVAGVVILAGIGVTIWWRAGAGSSLESPIATASLVVATPSEASPVAADAVVLAAASGPADRTPDSTAYWDRPAAGAAVQPSATGTLHRLTLDQAIDALAARMHDDLASIGFYRLLSASEITIPEKLWHGKRTLQDAGNIFEAYRVEVRQTREELRQLAAGAKGISAGQPPPRDEAGEPTVGMVESYEMEQVADSLVDQIDRLLHFLLERQSSYSITGGRLDFDHAEDATLYRALRARCDSLVTEDARIRRPGRHPLAPPMTSLRMVLDSLPEPTGR